jgi:hypothetical protein
MNDETLVKEYQEKIRRSRLVDHLAWIVSLAVTAALLALLLRWL